VVPNAAHIPVRSVWEALPLDSSDSERALPGLSGDDEDLKKYNRMDSSLKILRPSFLMAG